MTPGAASRLPASLRLAYGAPAFALAVVGIPVYVYLPKFYSDVVGVPIAAMGWLLLAARLFDAVTDPLIGHLSDRTATPWGRRRPYIAGGALFLATALLFLFIPPAGLGPGAAGLWFGAGIFFLFLFWTLVAVPYESLGPELTFDYDARTRLFALRDGLLIAGTLAAAASPAIATAALGLVPGPADERRRFFWIAAVYAPLLVLTCIWCATVVRERVRGPAAPARSLLRGLTATLSNRPFMVLLAAYTISAVGSNLPATLILYYVEYVLHSPRADLFLLIYFVTGILCLPAWVRVADRVGKRTAWLAAMAVNTGIFAGVFFLGPGDEMLYGVLVAGSGVGFGATLAIPSAIQADVIDYDELVTGERREGQYIGFWSVAKKLAAAVGVGTGLAVLGAAGYQPNQAQGEPVVLALRVLYALVPCLCNLLAIGVALAYPISGPVHAAIREAIAERTAGRPARDPLRPDAPPLPPLAARPPTAAA
jgi:GPH family glycoside/pentoside/hexuronide:cation symporter